MQSLVATAWPSDTSMQLVCLSEQAWSDCIAVASVLVGAVSVTFVLIEIVLADGNCKCVGAKKR